MEEGLCYMKSMLNRVHLGSGRKNNKVSCSVQAPHCVKHHNMYRVEQFTPPCTCGVSLLFCVIFHSHTHSHALKHTHILTLEWSANYRSFCVWNSYRFTGKHFYRIYIIYSHILHIWHTYNFRQHFAFTLVKIKGLVSLRAKEQTLYWTDPDP